MKGKLIKILQNRYDEENPWTTPYHAGIADEILELVEDRYKEGFGDCWDLELEKGRMANLEIQSMGDEVI